MFAGVYWSGVHVSCRMRPAESTTMPRSTTAPERVLRVSEEVVERRRQTSDGWRRLDDHETFEHRGRPAGRSTWSTTRHSSTAADLPAVPRARRQRRRWTVGDVLDCLMFVVVLTMFLGYVAALVFAALTNRIRAS